ncbi:hypothetical protein H6G74_03575 [Nostoc spongiaeforme FACHB-130]|uniref:Uncharacterized protein n=1 Tax=Nostoc spongiaeforme FACHB-130 TaxID=1357510 RepID=A0ABR8FPU1_9NOSO|nr:hypothetical protein [Nostoc spongiaeforme]MBD2593407.1 hypothetical protein [Nostoc spongiaeforme FACHB-130]
MTKFDHNLSDGDKTIHQSHIKVLVHTNLKNDHHRWIDIKADLDSNFHPQSQIPNGIACTSLNVFLDIC